MRRRTLGMFSGLAAVLIALLMVVPVGAVFGLAGGGPVISSQTALRIGNLQVIDSLNPYLGLNDVSYTYYGLVYDTLTSVGNDLEPVPNLATSWWAVPETDPELVLSGEPYGSVWEFNLTHNAVWSDGVPFTADDVVWNLNLNSENYWTMWAFEPYSNWMNYTEKIDNYTVRVHFCDRLTGEAVPAAYGYLLSIYMLPKHKLEGMSAADIGFTWIGAFPGEPMPVVGTGPFVATSSIVDDWISGSQITLNKNPNSHWTTEHGRTAHFDKIELMFFNTASEISDALRGNLVDVAEFPRETYASIKADVGSGTLENVTTYDGPAVDQYWTDVGFCMMNSGPNPSRLDPEIRESLAMATDKDYIVESFYLGFAEPGSTLVAPLNSYWHYSLSPSEEYVYNLNAAEKNLQDAGYQDIDSDGIRECTVGSYAVDQGLVLEGTELSYEMLVRMEHPEEVDIAQFLENEWLSIGVNVDIIIVDEPTLSSIVYSYSYDTAIWYWSQDIDPNYILWAQSSYALGGWNNNFYNSPVYDSDYVQSVMETDPVERKTHTDNCQLTHYLDASYLILAYVDQTYAWRTDTFSNWGDWAADPGRSIDNCWSGNPLYFDLLPMLSLNSPPEGLSLVATPDPAVKGSDVLFSASAVDVDGDGLKFYLEYGDGDSNVSMTVGGSTDPQEAQFVHVYLAAGNYTAVLWVDDGNGTPSHNVSIMTTVDVTETGPRTVDYRWYDMFNVPFDDAWYYRWTYYGIDEPLTDSYPFIFKRYGWPTGNTEYYTNMRLDVSAMNLPEINMTANPWFLPLLGSARGGNASINWDMFYPTPDQLNATHPGLYGQYDGWLCELMGDMVLDREAAMAVLGLSSAQFDNFANWWAANGAATGFAFSNWFMSQSRSNNPYHLDIYPAYERDMNILAFSLDAVKQNDTIVMSLDTVSWGIETLMTRWLRHAFMETEWWFDDFHMNATIGPAVADLDISTVVDYAAMAYETNDASVVDPNGTPCWVWEGMLTDYVISKPPAHPISDFDDYASKTLLQRSPGSGNYGSMIPYYYTPGALNLSDGESLTFEWPAGEQLFFTHVSPGEVGVLNSNMTVRYSEPMDLDVPGQVFTDTVGRTIQFVGPIDFWSWSKDQTSPEHQYLADEWARVGLMPWGMPYVEFAPDIGATLIVDHFVLADLPSDAMVGVPYNVTVTACAANGETVTDYTGRVTFSTDRPGEMVLPADYTFTLSDAGVHTFWTEVSFNATGFFSISCTDLSNPNITGSAMVLVLSGPRMMDHFVVDQIMDMYVGDYSDVRVSARDQYGSVFAEYTGTVTFSTDATNGTYILPPDYTFMISDGGQKTFTSAVSFSEPGTYSVTVTDVLNTSISGTQTDIVISPLPTSLPKQTFTIYDMFKEPFDDSWDERFAGYFQDYIISNEPGKYAWLYDPGQDFARGIIYAPYRWNTTAKNMTSPSIDNPEFIPVRGPLGVPGAEAEFSLYFTYLNSSWWNGYWVPTWSSDPRWTTSNMFDSWNQQTDDGYVVGVVYNITMNRAAAETWLGMPQNGTTPADWWAANSDAYATDWDAWIDYEGNSRLDIWCGYADKYYNLGSVFSLAELPDGSVSLTIGHMSWGYEVLMTRWLTESKVCTHEPYWEDFTMSTSYGTGLADVTFDAVGLYNLHAVKANESNTNEAAWVWEPTKIDYVASVGKHPSQFDPWAPLYYWSWNAGDPYFNDYVFYDSAPSYFNLTDYQRLVVKLREGDDVLGYRGEKAPWDAIYNMSVNNDYSFYNNLKLNGSMSLGYYITNPAGGGADLDSMYDSGMHTLTIQGPWDFEQVHHEGGPIYHGTPWIEFNVTPIAPEPVADAGPDQIVMGGVLVTFDGSNSSSVYGIATYTWTFVYDNDTVTLTGVNPEFTFWIEGLYEVTLTITDNMGRNDTDTMFVLVSGMIPEFDGLWVPLLIVMSAVTIAGLRRRRRA